MTSNSLPRWGGSRWWMDLRIDRGLEGHMTIREYVYQLYQIYLRTSDVRRIPPTPIAGSPARRTYVDRNQTRRLHR